MMILPKPPQRALLPLLVLAGVASLAACRGTPEPAATPAAPVQAEARTEPQPDLAPREPSRVRVRTSAEAPFACDVLSEEELGRVLPDEPTIIDVTTQRRAYGMAVESACLFAFGRNRDPARIDLDSRFIRVDLYTDASFRAAGHGALQDQWSYRVRDGSTVFHLHDTALAAWVDSEHPPDPALIVRQGEVMYDIAQYPAASDQGSPERKAQVEEIALLFLGKLDADEDDAGAN